MSLSGSSLLESVKHDFGMVQLTEVHLILEQAPVSSEFQPSFQADYLLGEFLDPCCR